MRLYVDTNVFADFLLERRNAFGKDIESPAFLLFARAMCCAFHLVVSDHALRELSKVIRLSETTAFFSSIKPKVIMVSATDDDERLARALPTHFSDALHVVLARKAGADVIIMRNVGDFSSIYKARLPEDV